MASASGVDPATPALLERHWTYRVGAGPAAGGDAPESFTVASFNMLADGLHTSFPNVDPAVCEWGYRAPLVYGEIERIAPDVCALVEVAHPEELSLRYGKDFFVLFAPKLSLGTGDAPKDGTALLVRASRFQVHSVNVAYLRDEARNPTARYSGQVAIVALLRDRVTRRQVVVAGAHLKAKGAFEELRLQQVRQLGDAIRAAQALAAVAMRGEGPAAPGPGVAPVPSVPAILMGDFNAEPTWPSVGAALGWHDLELESAYNRLTREACTGAGGSLDAAQYAAGEPPFTTRKNRTRLESRTIDFIFVSRLDKAAFAGAAAGTGAAGAAVAVAGGGAGAVAAGAHPAPRPLRLEALFSLPTAEAAGGDAGLPSASYPSDHLAVATKLAWQ